MIQDVIKIYVAIARVISLLTNKMFERGISLKSEFYIYQEELWKDKLQYLQLWMFQWDYLEQSQLQITSVGVAGGTGGQ